MPSQIMIIRHAEKPIPGRIRGVRQRGEIDECSLSVRGWQRAGALVRFFLEPTVPDIRVPTQLIAAGFNRSEEGASRRSRQTLIPLAHAMGASIDDSLGKHQEKKAAERGLSHDGVVLFAWHHEHIPALARAIAPAAAIPDPWPDDCFDRVWVFKPARGGAWYFEQIPQRLLAGDAQAIG